VASACLDDFINKQPFCQCQELLNLDILKPEYMFIEGLKVKFEHLH